MGTNYYWHGDVCECCGRSNDPIHIGKSSGGWCFALNTHEAIDSLGDWMMLFREPKSFIMDEYGNKISAEEMRATILDRMWRKERADKPYGYESWAQFHEMNYSLDGPNNLLRHKVDGKHCVGHGDGTYDLMLGEFS